MSRTEAEALLRSAVEAEQKTDYATAFNQYEKSLAMYVYAFVPFVRKIIVYVSLAGWRFCETNKTYNKRIN